MTRRERTRADLILMHMESMGLTRAASTDGSGRLLEPLLFSRALPAVYADLGPDGLDELTRQSGVDAFGNETEEEV